MANHNNNSNDPQATFWDFFQSDPRHGRGGAGQGADHMFGPNPSFPQGFPFDPSQFGGWAGNGQWGPWGGPFGGPWGHGHRGHHGHRHGHSAGTDEQHSEDDSTETMRPTPDSSEGPSDEDGQPPQGSAHPPPPPPAGAHPPPPPPPPPVGAHPHHPPPFGRPPHAFGPGLHRGRGGRCGMRGRGGHGGHRGRSGPPPPTSFTSPFDFRPLMQAFADHPFAQALRDYVDQTTTNGSPNGQDDTHGEDKFVPPVDIFNTETTYVLHFALPGASKEDIGVHWDSEKSSVIVAGVVYRPGNEELLQSMVSNERKVGMFERSIELPPAGSDRKEEVDGFGITAKMENGILVITVPKVEKDSWTEIHKIDVD